MKGFWYCLAGVLVVTLVLGLTACGDDEAGDPYWQEVFSLDSDQYTLGYVKYAFAPNGSLYLAGMVGIGDEPEKIGVYRLEKGQLKPIELGGIDPESEFAIELVVDHKNQLWLAEQVFLDPEVSLRIEKFDGKTWTSVGDDKFGVHDYFSFKLGVDKNGAPWVVQIPGTGSGPCQATVKKFDGADWVGVGDKIDLENQPGDGVAFDFIVRGESAWFGYIPDAGRKYYLYGFDGSSWEPLADNPPETHTYRFGPSLAVDRAGVAHLAYRDYPDYNLHYLRNEGGKWVEIGTNEFKVREYGTAQVLVLGDTPWLIFQDDEDGDLVKSYRWQNEAWELVGPAGLSADKPFSRDFESFVDQGGNIWLVGKDDDGKEDGRVFRYGL